MFIFTHVIARINEPKTNYIEHNAERRYSQIRRMLAALKELKRHAGKTLRLVAIGDQSRTSFGFRIMEINGTLFTMIRNFEDGGVLKMMERFIKSAGLSLFLVMTRRPATLEKMSTADKDDIHRILSTLHEEFKQSVSESMLTKLKTTALHFKKLIKY